MFFSIIQNLIVNLAIFTSVIFLIGHSLNGFQDRKTLLNKPLPIKLIMGLVHGGIGTLIMLFGFHIQTETLLDLRHFSIIVSAFFGGFPAALVTGGIIGVSRLLMDGVNASSIVGAVNALNMSLACGLIARSTIKRKWRYMNLYCLFSISIVAYLLIAEIELLMSVLLSIWGISIISALWIIYLINYLIRMNKLFHQVQESEEKYRIIAENMSDLVSVLDPKGRITYASPSHKTILNLDPNACIGTSPIHYIHPDDIGQVQQVFLDVLKHQCTIELECRLLAPNGDWMYTDMRGMPVIDQVGEVSKIILVSRNITKRKETEEQLIETLNELKDMKVALNEASIVTIADAGGKITYANNKFCEITGYTVGQLRGKTHRVIKSGYHPKEFFTELWETVTKGEIWRGEIKNRSRYGKMYWFDTTIVPFIDQDGNTYQYVAVRTDITERKRREERLMYLTNIDGLTDIPNRRYFDEKLSQEWTQSLQDKSMLSLILFDIDFFKAYNDTYGHQTGDTCLKTIASSVRNVVSHPDDLVARYGGEEFAVILPQTNAEGAKAVAEKILHRVEGLHIAHAGSKVSSYVTISLGAVTLTANELEQPKDLIERADQALYEAKNQGRNRVCIYSDNYVSN